MLPLVRALLAAGDEVTVASGADVEAPVTAAGAAFRPIGHGFGDWFATLAARTRGNPGDGLPPERIMPYFLPRLFGEIVPDDVIDDLLDCGRDLRPDLIVFDQESYAAPLAARILAVPAAQHLFGPLTDPEALQLVADAISPLWRSFGLDVDAHAGVYTTATIAVCPPSLETRAVPAGDLLPVRPTSLPRAAGPARARPLVYVTMGTQWADAEIVRTILAALADDPGDVLATVGTALEPGALGPVPPNARVERYVPQADVLPDCAAVVHHAGAGTMFGALAHGLPQVALPQAADNFVNAGALHRAGAARVLRPDEIGVDSVRAAVRSVLSKAQYADAARKIAAEIAEMPAPEEVADHLRRITGS
jgi:UDP:flavonoid glycosyltransferase YjiC (YdhE family)